MNRAASKIRVWGDRDFFARTAGQRKLFVALRSSVFLCCLLVLVGCVDGFMQQIGPSDNLPPASNDVIAEARDAWNRASFQEAEHLYGRATKMTLPSVEQTEAWERYALSAARNGRPHGALDALEQWARMLPGADATVPWQNAWLTSVSLLPPRQAIEQAGMVWDDKARPADLRGQAALILMGRSWSAPNSVQAMGLMHSLYVGRDVAQQQHLEHTALNEVRYMTSGTLQQLSQELGASQSVTFPATLIFLEQMRRGQAVPAHIQARLKEEGLFADPSLVTKTLAGSGTTGTPLLPMTPTAPTVSASANYQDTCLVLALPASGPIMPFAHRLRMGAEAAQQELSTLGATVDLRFIDTTQAQWMQEVAALPAQCVVVGGPMQSSLYAQAKASPALQNRRVFAFLPALSGQDEGTVAWRFFPSPHDQVDALLEFSRSVGVTSYGSFYPSDNYGTRMNEIFTQAAQSQGSSVHAVSYDPQSVSQWTKSAAELLQPERVRSIPLSTASFGGVFLPDSWKSMDIITAAFQFNGDDKQVLMGTSLWEQSLMGGGTTANTANYALAIFPGAWNPGKTPAVLNAYGVSDFWMGLGYDFVRFGANLALNDALSAQELNSRLQAAQAMPWAMAPLSWTPQGRAMQKLFVFNLTEGGITLADTAVFHQKRLHALTRFETRRNAARKATNE